MKEKRRFRSCQKMLPKMLFAAPFFLAKPLYKNVLSLRNVGKTACCPNGAEKHSLSLQSLAAQLCTVVDPFKTFRTRSVLYLEAEKDPWPQKWMQMCLLLCYPSLFWAHQSLAVMKQCPPLQPASEILYC